VDPVSAHGIPVGVLIEGVRQDHPEWFDDEDDEDEQQDQLEDDDLDDRWGEQPGASL
jgi:hypothetical protein